MEREPIGLALIDKTLGGVYSGSTISITGWVGVGKTTLATQMIMRGIQLKKKAIYLCTTSSPDIYIRAMESIGFPVELAVKTGWLKILYYDRLYDLKPSDIIADVASAVETMKANRIVIDTYTTLTSFFRDKWLKRMLTLQLAHYTREIKGLTIFVEEKNSPEDIGASEVEFISDLLINLSISVDSKPPKRVLRILKARGLPINPQPHRYEIGRGGIRIYHE